MPDDASFIDLGGDSLTYVQVAADIERASGTVPPGWHHRPLGELEATTVAARPIGRATIETTVLVRHWRSCSWWASTPQLSAVDGRWGGRGVSVALAVLAIGSVITVYEIGDSGARAVWTGKVTDQPQAKALQADAPLS